MTDFTSEDMAPQHKQDFDFRKACLVEEVKDAGIRRELWDSICDGAELIMTDKGLDDYLIRMQQQFNS